MRSTLLRLLPLISELEAITLAKNSFGAGSTRKYVLTMFPADFLIEYPESEALRFGTIRYMIDLEAILF